MWKSVCIWVHFFSLVGYILVHGIPCAQHWMPFRHQTTGTTNGPRAASTPFYRGCSRIMYKALTSGEPISILSMPLTAPPSGFMTALHPFYQKIPHIKQMLHCVTIALVTGGDLATLRPCDKPNGVVSCSKTQKFQHDVQLYNPVHVLEKETVYMKHWE